VCGCEACAGGAARAAAGAALCGTGTQLRLGAWASACCARHTARELWQVHQHAALAYCAGGVATAAAGASYCGASMRLDCVGAMPIMQALRLGLMQHWQGVLLWSQCASQRGWACIQGRLLCRYLRAGFTDAELGCQCRVSRFSTPCASSVPYRTPWPTRCALLCFFSTNLPGTLATKACFFSKWATSVLCQCIGHQGALAQVPPCTSAPSVHTCLTRKLCILWVLRGIL